MLILGEKMISALQALTDNYIWFIQDQTEIIVIDPGESESVLNYMEKNQMTLKAILLTHDHWDHINGVDKLLKHKKVPVYGMCSLATEMLKGGDEICLNETIRCKIIATPGHTYTSICYLMEIAGKQHLFCGDTLFAAGCGRVFTGDFEAMYDSLNQLKRLDAQCHIYPGHEYTLKNLSFAQFIEPENVLIAERISSEQKKFDVRHNTLPVTMCIEQATNPFFRCEDSAVVRAVQKILEQQVYSGFDCFLKLRELRNNF